MHFSRRLLCGLVLALCLGNLPGQEATEEQMKKALEILRSTEVGPDAKPSKPVPVPPAKPAPRPAEVPDPGRVPTLPEPVVVPEVGIPAPVPMEPEVAAPGAGVEPAVLEELVPAPILDPVLGPEEKSRRLQELLAIYRTDEITAAEYQKRRYEILGLREDAFANTVPIGPATSRRVAPLVRAGGAGGGLEAALVGGADLVLRFNLAAARTTSSYATLSAREQAGTEGADAGPDMMALGKKVEAILGLKEEDVNRVLLSADLDTVQGSPMGMDPKAAKNLMLVLGVEVAKDVTLAQLKEAIVTMAKEAPEPKEVSLVEKSIGRTSVLAMVPETEDDPEVHIAVAGGRTVLVGLNERSLAGALDRVGGRIERLETPVAAVMEAMPTNAQMRMVLVLPAGIKKMLADLGEMGKALAESGAGEAEGADAAGGGMGMLGMLGGLKDMNSISFSATFDEGLQLELMCDLGNADTAQGINMLVSMVEPQVIEGMATQLGKEMSEINPNVFKTAVDQGMLKISLSLDKELLEASK